MEEKVVRIRKQERRGGGKGTSEGRRIRGTSSTGGGRNQGNRIGEERVACVSV